MANPRENGQLLGRLRTAGRAAVATFAIAAEIASFSPAANAQTTDPGSRAGATSNTTECITSYNTELNWFNGYSKVELTSNPCDLTIQDRTLCRNIGPSSSWDYSPVTRKIDVWVRGQCDPINQIDPIQAQVRVGNGTWNTFWGY